MTDKEIREQRDTERKIFKIVFSIVVIATVFVSMILFLRPEIITDWVLHIQERAEAPGALSSWRTIVSVVLVYSLVILGIALFLMQNITIRRGLGVVVFFGRWVWHY
jgi:hypothetical protein